MVSVRRVAPVLLLLAALPLAAAAKKSSSRPPDDLHRVGDHWSAYTPPDPATYPPTAKTYTIKAGDTLWALGQQFYGNAYLWPQLWETNSWITDAHWIYPGDVLLVQGEAASQTASTTAVSTPTPTPVPTAAPSPASVPAGPAPIPIATEADLYCFGYIGNEHEPLPNKISSFEDTEMMYQSGVQQQGMSVSSGDMVFIDGGTATGIAAGETYLLVQPGDDVTNPNTKHVVGRHYDFVGQAKILCADANHSRAIITQSCREIGVGARLKPLPQLPIPIARIPQLPTICDPQTNRSTGAIVLTTGYNYALGLGDLVQVDIGRDDQIQPGDFLTVYRETGVAGQPAEVLGEVGVLTTENHTATGRVVAMRRSMRLGDRVEVR